MEKNINSIVTFVGYEVNRLTFKKNEDFHYKLKCLRFGNFNNDIEINYKLTTNLDDIVHGVLNIEMGKSNEMPFKLNLIVTGIFEKDEECHDLDHDILKTETLEILYPYARALVSSYLNTSDYSEYILPIINSDKFIKKESEV